MKKVAKEERKEKWRERKTKERKGVGEEGSKKGTEVDRYEKNGGREIERSEGWKEGGGEGEGEGRGRGEGGGGRGEGRGEGGRGGWEGGREGRRSEGRNHYNQSLPCRRCGGLIVIQNHRVGISKHGKN